jgi:hypothetical protein
MTAISDRRTLSPALEIEAAAFVAWPQSGGRQPTFGRSPAKLLLDHFD